MKYAEVAVDAPAGYSRTFTYSVPPSMRLVVGHVVRVPFGPRAVPGVVLELTNTLPETETRDVGSIAHPETVLTADQLVLARWMSDRYMAPIFDCAAAMMPPGAPGRALSYISLEPLPSQVQLSQSQTRIAAFVTARGRVERGPLLRSMGSGAENNLASLLRLGVLKAEWEWQRQRVATKLTTYVELALSPASATETAELVGKRAPKQAALLVHLVSMDAPISLTNATAAYGSSAVKGLEQKGLLRRVSRQIERDPLAGIEFTPDTPPTLTSDQRAAMRPLEAALDSGKTEVFLLQGVTGSGKTEVYLHALAHAVSIGKRGIIMVPELSLTPQTIERFGRRFPGEVAVLHSGLTPGERYDQWQRVKAGGSHVVVGSRSAVFAPQQDLGLIVIDEEHEWAYKQQDASPRYHAREVAIQLARLAGATVILGSATPDVVSYSRALGRRYQLLELPRRIVAGADPQGAGGALAPVQIVDLRQELRDGNRSFFSRALSAALSETLGTEGQVMLYLNRRGSGTLVQCRDCGHTLRCRRCDLPLTYHAHEERLLCHQCSYRLASPRRCPQCHGVRIRYLGLGTQRVVEEVQKAFPDVGVLRWDRDAASARGSHQATMDSFRRNEARVLVGTQMIAKGLDFPNVTLVGVLCADIGLFLPDYRAGERVFQLLTQVAGRTGRGPLGGRVVIQTYSPTHYAVMAASAQDYRSFYDREMTYRQEHGLPPHGRLIHLVYLHTNQAQCQVEARRFGDTLARTRSEWGLTNVDILGPSPAYPPRLRGRYRWHIVLRGRDPRALLDKVPVPHGWTIDIDPLSAS